MQPLAAPRPLTQTGVPELSCERCGRSKQVIDGDGPVICRVCLVAWGDYTRLILSGRVVREAGGVQLRHAAHDYPMVGCPLCRADQLRGAASFDGWLRNA
jgi:ribosomal protein S14